MIDLETKRRRKPKVACFACWAASRAPQPVCAVLAAMSFSIARPTHAQQTDRAKQLGQKLFCACGCTQVLTACNHVGCTRSTAMLKELDARIARGDSDDLILQSFVQEYGEKVLTEPPNKGFNRLAVIAPIAAPIAGSDDSLGSGAPLAQALGFGCRGRAADFAGAPGARAP